MTSDHYVQILEARARFWATQVADLQTRIERHASVLSAVPGTVLGRDPLWTNLHNQLEEARTEYIRHRKTALRLRRNRNPR